MLSLVVDINSINDLSSESLTSEHSNFTRGDSHVQTSWCTMIFILTIIVNVIRRREHSKGAVHFIARIYCKLRFKYPSNSHMSYKVFRKYIIWLSLYNIMLLIQCNLTMKNPGPSGLSIMYQNVQGLIPLHDLGNKNPILNQTKISELQSKVYKSGPDIVVLNETWLKPSINDNEIGKLVKHLKRLISPF